MYVCMYLSLPLVCQLHVNKNLLPLVSPRTRGKIRSWDSSCSDGDSPKHNKLLPPSTENRWVGVEVQESQSHFISSHYLFPSP